MKAAQLHVYASFVTSSPKSPGALFELPTHFRARIAHPLDICHPTFELSPPHPAPAFESAPPAPAFLHVVDTEEVLQAISHVDFGREVA